MPIPTRKQWVTLLKQAWDANMSCFRCQVSGVPLETSNKRSPRYLTLEHAKPGGFQVVAAVVNDMKSDLSLGEFKQVVKLLSDHFQGHEAAQTIESVLSALKHWKRA